jgi:hypothetical protein
VEVQWNNIKKCVLDTVNDSLGESKGERESHGLCRKGLMKWMNTGSVKMSTGKKE